MPVGVLLAIVWFFLLGGLGFFFPFISLYLRENAGLSGGEVGLIMAIPPLVSVFMQPVWGQIADRSGERSRVVAFLGLGTAAGYALYPHCSSFLSFALATGFVAVFATALIPSFVSVCLALLSGKGDEHLFGRTRVWGTIGFGVAVGTFPLLLDALQAFRGLAQSRSQSEGRALGLPEPGLELMFFLAAGAIVVCALLCLALPRAGSVAARADRGDWRLLFRHGPFVRLLGLMFFAYLFMQGPMALFPILVRAQGGGLDAVSGMWLLMLLLEVPLVFYLGSGIARIGPRGVVAIGMLAGGLRWTISGFAESMPVIYAAQLLHGVTVWGIVLGAPMYVDAVVPERLRSTGQGLLAMVGISLGSILSNVTAGYLMDSFDPKMPAKIGGLLSLALVLALPLILPKPHRHE